MTEKEHQTDTADNETGQPPAEAASDEQATTGPAQARPADTMARGLALLAVVLAGAALAGGYYLWQQSHQTVQQADFAAMQQTQSQQAQTNTKRLAELDTALQQQQQTEQQFQSAIEQFRERLGRDHTDWVIAEVEYLLGIANQRVQLQRDVQTAIKAFSIADQLLQKLANPRWYPVRQQISNEMTALRAVPQIDTAGITTKLISLSDRVVQLPVVNIERNSPIKDTLAKQGKASSKANWQTRVEEFAFAVWQELKGLVRVRKTNDQIKPLLAPVSQQFLIQNLKLQLQTARLAVVQDEPVVYLQSLQTASEWIKLYFDTESATTTSMLAELAELEKIHLSPELPDVSGSLQTLRNLRNTQTEAAQQAVDKPAEDKAADNKDSQQ